MQVYKRLLCPIVLFSHHYTFIVFVSVDHCSIVKYSFTGDLLIMEDIITMVYNVRMIHCCVIIKSMYNCVVNILEQRAILGLHNFSMC